MASATFNELKQEVTRQAEAAGTLPSSIRVHGMTYTLQMPVETKVRALQVAKNPARLDAVLETVTFVGRDGAEVHDRRLGESAWRTAFVGRPWWWRLFGIESGMQSSRPSRYHAIAIYLARHDARELVLTYAEIERLIGARLPLSASIILTWWTHPQALHVRMWREVGWHAQLDHAHRQVRFTRDEE